MNYSELVAETAAITNTPKKKVREILDTALEATNQELQHNGEVTLGTLGKFVVKNKPARTARNPRTGATVQVPAKWMVDFKVSKAFKDAIA